MKKLYIPKYCDANSILLINQAGILKRLFCPFRIECKEGVEIFQPGMFLWVDRVAVNDKGELIYLILNIPYVHKYFEVRAVF